MDMSYATIIVYGGGHLRLYREVKYIKFLCNSIQPINNPIYVVDQDLGCFILAINDECSVHHRI